MIRPSLKPLLELGVEENMWQWAEMVVEKVIVAPVMVVAVRCLVRCKAGFIWS